MPSLPPAATRGRKLAHSRSLVYSAKCIKVLPCDSVGIIAIVVVEPACECRTTFSGSLGLALFLHLWAHETTGLVRGQARGKCVKNGSSLGGRAPGCVLAWGHFLILKFWNFRWPLVLRLVTTLWGQVDPAFPVEKLFLSVCLCLCPRFFVGLSVYFFPIYVGGGGPPVSLLFPGFVCACLHLSSPSPSLCLFSVDIFVFLTHP